MTRRLALLDRVAALAVGLVLLAAGLALLDWRFEKVGSWPAEADTSALSDLMDQGWWPWAFAAGSVLVGLVALVWLLSHAPRRSEGAERMSAVSSREGNVRVDLGSAARAVAADFSARTAIADVKGTARRRGATHVIELRGHLDARSAGAGIDPAAERCTRDVADAFPDGAVVCRVLLGSSRRRTRLARTSTPRVH
ncbi:MAG: hypothetical protein EON52_10290 [Actinomycetales bacterium]|nr:MAG: hypothetical protein EON52_10290 [Actinomycetales bacterium]